MWLLRTRVVQIGIIVGCFVASIAMSISIVDLWQRRSIVADRQKVLSHIEEENKRLKEAFSEAQTPQFVEKQAREKLGMVKAGETVILMDRVEGLGDRGQEKQKHASNWEQWVRLFF